MTKYEERIRDELVDFFANMKTCFSSEANLIAGMAQRDWDNLPCDPEGATDEQDEEMEKFLAKRVLEILDLDRIWAKDFVFSLNKKNEPVNLQDSSKYDGTVINAPDEETAWDLFLSMDGKFGIPDASDYSCAEIK